VQGQPAKRFLEGAAPASAPPPTLVVYGATLYHPDTMDDTDESSPPIPAPAGRWAIIDIGSDTVHLLVADIREGEDTGRTVKVLSQRSVLLELGRDVAVDGRIDSAQIPGLDATVTKYAKTARREAKHLVVVGTEASRRAANGSVVIERLSKRIDEPIRILSGVREAQLGFRGVRPNLKGAGCQLVIDSGGASTEVSVSQGREYVAGVSLPVGSALLAASLRGDPPSPISWALSALPIGTALSKLPQMQPKRAWATGGSAHHLAGLESAESTHKSPRLSIAELDELAHAFLTKSSQKLGQQRHQDPRRVALLPTGALILAAVLRAYNLEQCTVLSAGLREGILLAASENPLGWWQDASFG